MNIRNYTFNQRCLYGFLLCFLSLFISDALNFPQLYSIAWTLFGVTFLIWPDVPDVMKEKCSASMCSFFGRFLGVLSIIGGWIVNVMELG